MSSLDRAYATVVAHYYVCHNGYIKLFLVDIKGNTDRTTQIPERPLGNYQRMTYTPVKRWSEFFDTIRLPFIFVVCSSFHTLQCEVVNINSVNFCYFDHWSHLNDILKRETGSKPDVALICFIHWERMVLKHGEKDWKWCLKGCNRFVCKFYKLPKTCQHTQVDSLVDSYEGCTIE